MEKTETKMKRILYEFEVKLSHLASAINPIRALRLCSTISRDTTCDSMKNSPKGATNFIWFSQTGANVRISFLLGILYNWSGGTPC